MEDSPVPVSCNFSLHLFASITDTLNPGETLLVWLDDGCFVVLLRRTGSCDLLLRFIVGWPCPLLSSSSTHSLFHIFSVQAKSTPKAKNPAQNGKSPKPNTPSKNQVGQCSLPCKGRIQMAIVSVVATPAMVHKFVCPD